MICVVIGIINLLIMLENNGDIMLNTVLYIGSFDSVIFLAIIAMVRYAFYPISFRTFQMGIHPRTIITYVGAFFYDVAFVHFIILSVIYCMSGTDFNQNTTNTHKTFNSIIYIFYQCYLWYLVFYIACSAFATLISDKIPVNIAMYTKWDYIKVVCKWFVAYLSYAVFVGLYFLLHGAIWLVETEKSFFLNKFKSHDLAPNMFRIFLPESTVNGFYLIKQQSKYNFQFWQECIKFISNPQAYRCEFNDSKRGKQAMYQISKEQDRILRLCCINYIVLKYARYPGDGQFCEINDKIDSIYYNYDNNIVTSMQDLIKQELKEESMQISVSNRYTIDNYNKNLINTENKTDNNSNINNSNNDELHDNELKLDIGTSDDQNAETIDAENGNKQQNDNISMQIATYQEYQKQIGWYKQKPTRIQNVYDKDNDNDKDKDKDEHERKENINTPEITFDLQVELLSPESRDKQFSHFIENSAYNGYENIRSLDDFYDHCDIAYFKPGRKYLPLYLAFYNLIAANYDDIKMSYDGVMKSPSFVNSNMTNFEKKGWIYKVNYSWFNTFVLTSIYVVFQLAFRIIVPIIHLIYFGVHLILYLTSSNSNANDNDNDNVFDGYIVYYWCLVLFANILIVNTLYNFYITTNNYYYLFYICPTKEMRVIYVSFNYVEHHYNQIIESKIRKFVLINQYGNDIGLTINEYLAPFDKYYNYNYNDKFNNLNFHPNYKCIKKLTFTALEDLDIAANSDFLLDDQSEELILQTKELCLKIKNEYEKDDSIFGLTTLRRIVCRLNKGMKVELDNSVAVRLIMFEYLIKIGFSRSDENVENVFIYDKEPDVKIQKILVKDLSIQLKKVEAVSSESDEQNANN